MQPAPARAASEVVRRLLRAQVQGVLATVAPGGGTAALAPSTHLMAYAHCPRLQTVFLATGAGTRKERNMRACPAVSMLWDDRTGNLADHAEGTLAAAAGTATALEATAPDAAEALAAMRLKNPNMEGFLSAESTVLFSVAVREWSVVEGYGATRVWDPWAAPLDLEPPPRIQY
jgi:hypothetical protein